MWAPKVNAGYLCSTRLILFLNIIYTLCVRLLCLHVCFYIMCVPSAHWGQRRALDTLKMELQTVVSSHVGAGDWTRTFWRAASAPDSWAISPSQPPYFTRQFLTECGAHRQGRRLCSGSQESPRLYPLPLSQLCLLSTLPTQCLDRLSVCITSDLTMACLKKVKAYLRNSVIMQKTCKCCILRYEVQSSFVAQTGLTNKQVRIPSLTLPPSTLVSLPDQAHRTTWPTVANCTSIKTVHSVTNETCSVRLTKPRTLVKHSLAGGGVRLWSEESRWEETAATGQYIPEWMKWHFV